MFDTQLVFQIYEEDLNHVISRGFFKKKTGHPDHLPSVSRQLLDGLAHMHSFRIIHRDVKPSNMLAAIGARDAAVGANHAHVVLSDLGSTVQLTDAAADDLAHADKSGGRTFMGTYAFRAPELFCVRPAWDYNTYI